MTIFLIGVSIFWMFMYFRQKGKTETLFNENQSILKCIDKIKKKE